MTLQDGSYIFGRMLSSNPQVDETSDRSPVLAAPIVMRCEGEHDAQPLDADTVVISAGQIRFVTVSYLENVLSVIPTTPQGPAAI